MKTALVAGASGLAGRAIIDRLRQEGGFQVLALARRADALFADVDDVVPIACDLFDEANVRNALEPFQVNYLFYAAVYTGAGGVANFSPRSDIEVRLTLAALRNLKWPARLAAAIAPNAFYNGFHSIAGGGEPDKNRTMFRHVLDACRGNDSALEHVVVITGGKYYGHHLGPRFYSGYIAPFEESHPRAPGLNWYYAVEDYLASAQSEDNSWNYSTLRPSSIMGFATGSPYNLGTSLAVYATIRKYLGLPLLLAADPVAQNVDIEFSPADLLADMALWSTREPRCRNESYNASFGARSNWREVWPTIAEYFGMAPEYAQRAQCVGRITKDYPAIWSKVSREFETTVPEFNQVCSPAFMDQQFMIDWDAGYSPEKARAHGFPKSIDPNTMFNRLFDQLIEQRAIPDPKHVNSG